MKKILFLLFFLPLLAKAQNFEGSITWKMTSEILDPKMKTQMEEAQKKMADPATQSQMKEMQEKMNDPQFKKMMESNPQLKQQIEAAMKMTQGGDLSSMIPKAFLVKVKSQNVLTQMDGGAMSNYQFLYLADKKESYQVNRDAKTFVRYKSTEEEPKDKQNQPKVTKTSETQKIYNHTCTKYIVEMNENGKEIKQFIWSTTEITDLDFSDMAKHAGRAGSDRAFFMKDIKGVPLKMETFTKEMNITMEVTDIKRGSLPASEFAIPSHYKETKGMF